MFEKMEYTVNKIDGDYAYLVQTMHPEFGEKCVARALLPDAVDTGACLIYEMMQYRIKEE